MATEDDDDDGDDGVIGLVTTRIIKGIRLNRIRTARLILDRGLELHKRPAGLMQPGLPYDVAEKAETACTLFRC